MIVVPLFPARLSFALSRLDITALRLESAVTNRIDASTFGKVVFEKADLLIEMVQAEGYVANSDKGITVVMDTKLTPELIEEGFVRELVSKIQTMRKDAGFEVMDRINVYVSGNDKIAALMEKNAEQVKAVVLADNIIAGEAKGFTKDWNINGEDVTLGVEKQ